MVAPSKGQLLYHMTHMDNMASIIRSGLMPRASLSSTSFTDIANPEIIEKREKDTLSCYVPFHFFSCTPFDYAVCHDFGADNMAIITIWRSKVRNESYIIPMHPLAGEAPQIMPYDEGFKAIDWICLDNFEGRDYSDPVIRKKAMAECLLDRKIRSCEFAYIYVINDENRQKILELGFNGEVQVSPHMFPQSA